MENQRPNNKMFSDSLNDYSHEFYDPDLGMGYFQQELDEYFSSRDGQHLSTYADVRKLSGKTRVEASEVQLDPIPEYIPAQCRPEIVDYWIYKSAFLCQEAFAAVRYLLKDQKDYDRFNKLQRQYRRSAHHNPTAHERERVLSPQMATFWLARSLGKKKNILGRQPPPMSQLITDIMIHMRSSRKMFEVREDFTINQLQYDWNVSADAPEKYVKKDDTSPLHQLDKCQASVSNFVVPKPGGDYRFIVNARWTNSLFNPSSDSYSVFSIEHVRQVIGNLSQHDEYFVANLDLRHWFHQLPLPERYRHLFLMHLRNGEFWTPCFVPMGWVKSPPIAQALTWALLLANDQGGFLPFNKLDISANDLKKYTSTPRWLPLNSGGGIFVILDNILIVTPKEEVRQAWYDQLYRKCEAAHAVLKVKAEDKSKDPPEPFTPEYRQLLHKQALKTMKRHQVGKEYEFEFMGIMWGHGYFYIDTPQEDRIHLYPPGTVLSDDGKKILHWIGTHRQLASILGRINWHRRVYQLKNYDNSLAALHIRAAYKILTPPENRWSQQLPEPIPANLFEGIVEAWKLRNLADENRQYSKVQKHRLTSYKFIATDASSSERLASAVFIGKSLMETPQIETWSHNFTDHRRIALAELYAILQAVLDPRSRDCDLLVLATDSMTCKSWIERGCSPRDEANEMLQQILTTLENHNQRLYVIYVPTEENVADEPSRRKIWERVKLEATRRRLDLAFMECQGAWAVAGGTTGASDLTTTEDESVYNKI